MRTMALDGNFKLDNLTMKNPEGDVSLSDGEAMFVGTRDFEAHLAEPRPKKVSAIIIIIIITLTV